jgi:hypothetical protein
LKLPLGWDIVENFSIVIHMHCFYSMSKYYRVKMRTYMHRENCLSDAPSSVIHSSEKHMIAPWGKLFTLVAVAGGTPLRMDGKSSFLNTLLLYCLLTY